MGKSTIRALAICLFLSASPASAKENKKWQSSILSSIVSVFNGFKETLKESKEDWQNRQKEKYAQKEKEKHDLKAIWQAAQKKKNEESVQAEKEKWLAKQAQKEQQEQEEQKPKKKKASDVGIQIENDLDEEKPSRHKPSKPNDRAQREKEEPDPAEEDDSSGSQDGMELVKKSRELEELKDANQNPDIPETVQGTPVKQTPPPPPGVIMPHPGLLAMAASLRAEEKTFNLEGPAGSLQETLPTSDELAEAAVLEQNPKGSAPVPSLKTTSSRQAKGLLSVRSAKAKLDNQDYLGALQAADKAIEADPTNPEGYVRRAEANIHLNNFAAAEKDARQALKLNFSYAQAHKTLAWIELQKKDFAGAAASALRAVQLRPNDADAHALAGQAYRASGQKNKALQHVKTASELDPRYRDSYQQLLDETSSLPPVLMQIVGQRSPWRLPLAAGAGLLAAGAVITALRRKKTPIQAPASGGKRSTDGLLDGKYENLRVIGRGGMGTVYEATDRTLGRPVAIKKVSEDLSGIGSQAREMLLKEARTVASLDHPAIVEIYEIFEEDSNLYVVFELLRGKTVAQLVAERGRLGLEETLGILRPVCQALGFAHEREVVHRDLKPANIMVTESGQVKLMDFGIARSVSDAVPLDGVSSQDQPKSAWLARTKTVAGTPAYMAPEAEQGLVSRGTDIYALGACLYELTTGRPPFPHDANLMQRLSTRITPPSELDASLAAIDSVTLQALDPQPSKRPASAAAFLSLLESAVRGQAARA